jgi:hypothetical protein
MFMITTQNLGGIEADTGPAELSTLARLLVESWNRRDARAFARLFTPAAEYVTGAGIHIRGREAISALLDKAGPATQVECRGWRWTEARQHNVPLRMRNSVRFRDIAQRRDRQCRGI